MGLSWYYLRGANREGPISEDEVQRLLDLGALTHDTLVWSESLSNWTQIRDIPAFRLSVVSVPPPPPIIDQSLAPEAFPGTELPITTAPHPWVRYWARYIDMILCGLGVGLIWGIVDPDSLQTRQADAAFALGTAFIWVFVESSLLSTWGTTPGKWLLKTTLRNTKGQKLSFVTALNRSFSVWWKGIGIGFPLATLITCIIAYKKLMRTGMTSWDRSGSYVVTHQPIGALRTFVAVFFLIAVFSFVALDEMSSQGP